jgi:hypothetical protein
MILTFVCPHFLFLLLELFLLLFDFDLDFDFDPVFPFRVIFFLFRRDRDRFPPTFDCDLLGDAEDADASLIHFSNEPCLRSAPE